VQVCFTDCNLLQRHVLSLDGPVVTASGFKDELAIVTHACDCLPSNDQVLFQLFVLIYHGDDWSKANRGLTLYKLEQLHLQRP
jgi:hypothetical protein